MKFYMRNTTLHGFGGKASQFSLKSRVNSENVVTSKICQITTFFTLCLQKNAVDLTLKMKLLAH